MGWTDCGNVGWVAKPSGSWPKALAAATSSASISCEVGGALLVCARRGLGESESLVDVGDEVEFKGAPRHVLEDESDDMVAMLMQRERGKRNARLQSILLLSQIDQVYVYPMKSKCEVQVTMLVLTSMKILSMVGGCLGANGGKRRDQGSAGLIVKNQLEKVNRIRVP